MTIYEELIERVSNGEPFCIDFEKRNMRVGKEYLIKNGKYDTTKKLISTSEESISIIEKLYQEYQTSLPSERSENKRRKYFKALPIEELTINNMVNGQLRDVAQCKLEGYILCSILNGDFKWNKDVMGDGWFWQSENNKNLILLRTWIELDSTKLI